MQGISFNKAEQKILCPFCKVQKIPLGTRKCESCKKKEEKSK